MRILLIADPMLPVPPKHYGGIERIIDMLCRSYAASGHEVTLLAHPASETEATIVPLPGLEVSRKWDIARNTATLIQLVRRFHPDVVHSFGRLAQLLPLLPSKLPKIMSYQREPSLSGIRRAFRLARRGSLLFTGCSNYISHQIQQFADCDTVYNGVPIERFDFRSQTSDDAPLVFLGRLERIKGVHNAIAIARQTGRRLVIAGNIPAGAEHQEYFRSEVEPHLCETIEYIGVVDDHQKNKLLGESLALVMAIEWNEPFGIVMAEALACGTPILGTPMGAVPEVISDGETGFVGNVNELVSSVDKVAKLQRADCRARCESLFGDSVIASRYLSLYRQMQNRPMRAGQ